MKKLSVFLKVMVFLLMLVPAGMQADAKTYVYYGNKLDSFNKKVYKATLKTAKKGLGTTTMKFDGGERTITRGLASYISNDHPEIYWINGYTITTSYLFWEGNSIAFTPMPSWRNAAKSKTAFTKKVNAIVNKLKKKCKGKNAAMRAKVILDYLAANCSYAFTTYDQTAYGVFMKKKAVCAGYARAYKLLCDRLGVTCICVEGQVNGENHMVNYVRIGKKWYYVDPTWCDQGKTAITNFFLLGRVNSGCTVTYSAGVKMPKLTAKDYPMAR